MIECRDLKYWDTQIKIYDINVSLALNDNYERPLMSELLLDGLRHFTEAVMCYIREANDPREFLNRYDEIKCSKAYCNSISKYNFISIFDDNLNGSVGHQDFFGEYAVRLFQKYYGFLIRIKEILKNEYALLVLEDLSKYPIDLDDSFVTYYRLILEKLSKNYDISDVSGCDSYYIQKKKMIYIDNVIFYEYTLTNATDNSSRFDRFMAFSVINMPTNYAIKAKLKIMHVNFFEKNIDLFDVISFTVAIRPCELNKLSVVMGLNYNFSRTKEYWNLMKYITDFGYPLNKIVEFADDKYNEFSSIVFSDSRNTMLQSLLYSCREFLHNKNRTGSNTLRYLLFKLNNNIISSQIPFDMNKSLSSIFLKKDVYGFDKTPFSICPPNHIPNINDLIEVYNISEHKSELLAKTIKKQSIENACIYISKNDLQLNDLDNVIEHYNSNFKKPSLENRKILTFGNYVYLNENELNTKDILLKLSSLTNEEHFYDYKNYINSIIKEDEVKFDDLDKERALKSMFDKSSVFAVYGPAGSGKSYFASYVLKALKDINKVCIACTNPAVDNMRRKFDDNTAEYMTIEKYLNNKTSAEIGLLVIDECSNVSAKEMNEILSKTNPSLILLLGDICQIKPIAFGNWFSLLRYFIRSDAYVDLNNQYRCETKTLLSVWNEVRKLGKNIKELLSANEISHAFDSSIFKQLDKDEIILCLNYDGLYGINNINRVLQKNNSNKEFRWKQYIFKVDDPIIFIDSIYSNVLYNNLKGIIRMIDEQSDRFIFTVKVNRVVNSIACQSCGINYIELDDDGTLLSFEVKKYGEDYYDNDSYGNTCFTFQIAYALSIHKAQGLEYESVKIIISNEIEENISHNIFYTAITRAKRILNIYWTPESEEKIINNFYIESYDNDANILSTKYSELTKHKNYY